MDKTEKTDEEWREQLTPEQYEVTRKGGTERAFTGPYVDEKGEGMYRCGGRGAELFSTGSSTGAPAGPASPSRPTSSTSS